MKILLSFAALVAMVSFASDARAADIGGGCEQHTLCSTQTATGDCTDSAGTFIDRRVGVKGRQLLSLYSTQSTASTFSCDVRSNDTGRDADAADYQVLNSTSLTESGQLLTLDGLFDYVWVNCSAINADGNVTITMLSCP